jgi:hypothetical protein
MSYQGYGLGTGSGSDRARQFSDCRAKVTKIV